MLAEQDEEVCLIARRHGIVLARPIMRSLLLAAIGVFLLTLPWVAAAGLGAVVFAAAAAFTFRAVWQWERTRLVVTTEKIYVVDGLLHRRAKAVRLGSVHAVELDQTLLGQLLGYGTVVIGPLCVGHVAEPQQVCRLIERMADAESGNRYDRLPLPAT
jgi:uncharacterized membrane protein YdbT with pleckstrin-like domain